LIQLMGALLIQLMGALLIQLMGAQSLFELNWIQAQPPKVKLIKYACDL